MTKNKTESTSERFSEEERAAIKERASEVRASGRGGRRSGKAADNEPDVLAKIAEMSRSDSALAERLHAVITAAAPDLSPKLWYGMPAYTKDGKVVCFFQNSQKFKTRYSTLGFNDTANLDDGAMWPTSYALTELSEADEATITALIERAVS